MLTLNRKTIQKIMLVIAILLLHIFFQETKNNKEKLERTELVKRISKKLYKQEVDARKEIYKLEKEMTEVKNKNVKTQKKIETANNNYKKILFTIKKLNNEKLKSDNEIYNASDSSDRDWFVNRFPKHNKQLSAKTNQIIRKSSKNGQLKSSKTQYGN